MSELHERIKTMHPDEFLTPHEVAVLFGVDPKTVSRWEIAGRIPRAMRTPGGHRRFRVGTIRQMLTP
jgi:excisionase family DNA binding protein